jgi:hypothetical protein
MSEQIQVIFSGQKLEGLMVCFQSLQRTKGEKVK